MRLSEAIMMGAATCKMVPGDINSCAYGAALNAEGIPTVTAVNICQRYEDVARLWPWTVRQGDDRGGWYLLSAKATIVFRHFDTDVCMGLMTLEQLADYVRSIEPDCDCNRFNCNCKAQQESSAEVEHAHQT